MDLEDLELLAPANKGTSISNHFVLCVMEVANIMEDQLAQFVQEKED